MSHPTGPTFPSESAAPKPAPAPKPATYARALAAGATPVTEVTAVFFGDRVGRVRDPLATSGGSRPTWKTSIPPSWPGGPKTPRRPALRYVETSLDTAMREREA